MASQLASVWFVTGTDTGVGKTVMTAALIRQIQDKGIDGLAIKPISSGARLDARLLRSAQEGRLSLPEINPWHFRAPLTPMLAARAEGQPLSLKAVEEFVRSTAVRCRLLIIEGAGGLLSPLGEGFDARALIRRFQARPIVVCANRLGAVNQAALAMNALGTAMHSKTCLVLMQLHPRKDLATRTNRDCLQELFPRTTIIEIPYVASQEGQLRGLGGGPGFQTLVDVVSSVP